MHEDVKELAQGTELVSGERYSRDRRGMFLIKSIDYSLSPSSGRV